MRHNWQQRPTNHQSSNNCPGAASSSRGNSNCRMQHQQDTGNHSNEWSTNNSGSAGSGTCQQQQQYHMYPSSTTMPPHYGYGPCHMFWYVNTPTGGPPVPMTTTPDLCYPPPLPPPPFQYHPHTSAAGAQREIREHSPSVRDMQSFNYYMY